VLTSRIFGSLAARGGSQCRGFGRLRATAAARSTGGLQPPASRPIPGTKRPTVAA
jgi:hypothetical protein